MLIKHHFGKNKLTETTHSFSSATCVPGSLYFLPQLQSPQGLCPSTQQRKYDYFALLASNLPLKKYYLRIFKTNSPKIVS